MTDDLKNQIDTRQDGQDFIKTTEKPLKGLSDKQKVALIRKANELFNNGKIEEAKKVYMATGYSDGLTRVGDKYAQKDRYMDALKLYTLAHNDRKKNPLIEKMAQIVSAMLEDT